MTKWTIEDQQQLEELLDRKSTFVNTHKPPVVKAVEIMYGEFASAAARDQLVDKLMRHAELLRDVLAPFDSGVRVEAPGAD